MRMREAEVGVSADVDQLRLCQEMLFCLFFVSQICSFLSG